MTEKKAPRTPGRKLAKEDLAKATGGRVSARLAEGCCGQSCCDVAQATVSSKLTRG